MKGLRVLVLIAIATWWGPAAADIDETAALVDRAKDAVAYKMKDPDSVKFRELRVTFDAEDLRVVCGEVNAKNSYGAYSGFSRFYYIEGKSEPRTEIESGTPPMVPAGWDVWCNEKLKNKTES